MSIICYILQWKPQNSLQRHQNRIIAHGPCQTLSQNFINNFVYSVLVTQLDKRKERLFDGGHNTAIGYCIEST